MRSCRYFPTPPPGRCGVLAGRCAGCQDKELGRGLAQRPLTNGLDPTAARIATYYLIFCMNAGALQSNKWITLVTILSRTSTSFSRREDVLLTSRADGGGLYFRSVAFCKALVFRHLRCTISRTQRRHSQSEHFDIIKTRSLH